MLKWKSLVLLSLTIEIAKCFITRLPNRYYANFQIEQNMFYSFANTNYSLYRALQHTTLNYCIQSCIMDLNCVLINFKQDGTKCHLHDSRQGKLIYNTSWQFLYTRSPGAQMGQICESKKPCLYLELCKDVEQEPGYVCLAMTNVARDGVATQSSTHSVGKAENAIDGITPTDPVITSVTHTISEIKPWWILDLIKPYEIIMIRINNRVDCCQDRLSGFIIRIGPHKTDLTKNAFCSFINQGNVLSQDYYCEYGFLTGRYVGIVTEETARKIISLAELEIWLYRR